MNNNRRLRSEMRAAWPEPSERLVPMTEALLDNLPRRARPAPNRALRAAIIAAAVVLLAAFAGQPIVRGVNRVLARLFNDKVDQVEQVRPENSAAPSIQPQDAGGSVEAVPLDIHSELDGIEYTLDSFYVTDDRIGVTASARGYRQEGDKERFMLRVFADGMEMGIPNFSTSDEIKDGTYQYVRDLPLQIGKVGALPERSTMWIWIYPIYDALNERHADEVFQYEWATRKVIPPMDDAQRQVWLDESRARRIELSKAHPMEVKYDMRKQGITQTLGGMMLKLKSLNYYNGGMTIEFASNRDIPTKHRPTDVSTRIDGLPALPISIFGNARLLGIGASPQQHHFELGDGSRIQLDIPISIPAKGKKPAVDQVFHFDFVLDNESMQPAVKYMNPDTWEVWSEAERKQ